MINSSTNIRKPLSAACQSPLFLGTGSGKRNHYQHGIIGNSHNPYPGAGGDYFAVLGNRTVIKTSALHGSYEHRTGGIKTEIS